MKIKTAHDYMTEYTDLKASIAVLESKISRRLIDLCKQHPDVPVARKADIGGTIIMAKTVGNPNYINSLAITDRISYIHIIEKWLEEQNPVKQMEIDFKENEKNDFNPVQGD
jgi:hypothetical protein